MAVISTFTSGPTPIMILIESDWADIAADSIDLNWSGWAEMRGAQFGVQMATGTVGTPGTFGVATSGEFDIDVSFPESSPLDAALEAQAPSINANTPLALRRGGTSFNRVRCTRDTIVAGSMTQFRLVVSLYPD